MKDGNVEHITREPEQVKAFRDTWRDGIHSYLTYLRDRLTVCRDLLADRGSIFVQIGDENLHRMRTLLDEVFGRVAGHVSSDRYDQIELSDGVERRLKREELERQVALPDGRIFRHTSLISSGQASSEQVFEFQGREFRPGSSSHWKTTLVGLGRLAKAGRVAVGNSTILYKRFIDDFAVLPITDR